ncbi:hypothetical protein E4O06_09245 [Treponema sp. OMZ 789]|nr:hypothetical protein E4O06_09245 [Treponema sp. OMZ 789]UTC71219.1 hypothetical protein E4O01_09380 [Treponema sp. OMZ 790]UTC73937.1 hypothetical protein E4O02_09570 [Treponema sp. OMZ 791]
MDIKTFRKLFAEKVLEQIGNEGFVYKSSRELFIKTEGKHQFFIFVYMYKRSTFIEIQTQIYYGDKSMNKELKKLGIKPDNEELCGGNIDYISESYFNKKFTEKYNNLIFMLNEAPNCVIKTWLEYYESIMKPFFEDCLDPQKLHNIINRKIESAGFAVTYATRIEKFYFVAKNAGLQGDELQELIDRYEDIVIERKSETDYTLEYHNTFYVLKEKLFDKKIEK